MSLDLTTPCILAHGIPSGSGYGQATFKGHRISPHKLVYELAHGPLGDGQMVRHACDNRQCINLFHLEAGTHQDNMDDRNSRQRQARGERHGCAKLNDEDVYAIRAMRAAGEKLIPIANRFNISISLVSMIANRKEWAHLPER